MNEDRYNSKFKFDPKGDITVFYFLNLQCAYFEIEEFEEYSIVKAIFHSVQFNESAEFCDRFLLKFVQSAISNEFVLHDYTHFKRKRSQNCTEWKSAFMFEPLCLKYDHCFLLAATALFVGNR